MRTLGIYFGFKKIGLVEADGKKIITSSSLPIPAPESPTELPAATESRLFALIKDAMRKNLVEAKTACLAIPGKDLIIRSFYMPVLPSAEMASAVRFEAKKYIPFKLEEMVCDFRSVFDKTERKNLILFAGIKKESANRYISLLTQLGLKAESLEYSGFSMLRLLQAAGVKEAETVALVNVDIAEDDEVNFIVLDNGFPLFDRDIVLPDQVPSQADAAAGGQSAVNDKLEKLKTELRISLDFYLRKFPARAIKKMVFVAPADMRVEMEAFAKERQAACRFIDGRTLTDKPIAYSTCVFKAYSAALHKSVPLKIAMDLLAVSRQSPSAKPAPLFGIGMPALNIDFKFVVIGALLLGLTIFWGQFRKGPIREDIETTIKMRPSVVSINKDADLEKIRSKKAEIDNKIKVINTTLRNRVLLTAAVDALPRLMPEGLWLKDIVFRQERGVISLDLVGYVYKGDNSKEIEAVNQFKVALKENKNFSTLFESVEIDSVIQQQYEKKNVNSFHIVCRTARGKR